jgi:hypothetical protein
VITYSPGGGGAMMMLIASDTVCPTPGSIPNRLSSVAVIVKSGVGAGGLFERQVGVAQLRSRSVLVGGNQTSRGPPWLYVVLAFRPRR